LRQELARLNRQRKQHNIERLARMEQYRRQTVASKLDDDERRTVDMEEQKKTVLLQRQKTKMAIDRQKFEMLKTFEKLKSKRGTAAAVSAAQSGLVR
jgi:hypothetical protein